MLTMVAAVFMTEFTDDNTNMVMVIAKSHFRDRVWNPLVLYTITKFIEKHHAASMGRIGREISYTMV